MIHVCCCVNVVYVTLTRVLIEVTFYLFIPCFSQASHRDMGEHRLVPTDEVVAFIQHLERQVSLMLNNPSCIIQRLMTLLVHSCTM